MTLCTFTLLFVQKSRSASPEKASAQRPSYSPSLSSSNQKPEAASEDMPPGSHDKAKSTEQKSTKPKPGVLTYQHLYIYVKV